MVVISTGAGVVSAGAAAVAAGAAVVGAGAAVVAAGAAVCAAGAAVVAAEPPEPEHPVRSAKPIIPDTSNARPLRFFILSSPPLGCDIHGCNLRTVAYRNCCRWMGNHGCCLCEISLNEIAFQILDYYMQKNHKKHCKYCGHYIKYC
jgi:hypothetical protein